MLLRDALTRGVNGRNLTLLRTAVDWLRSNGHDYHQTWRIAHNFTGISLTRWETLMYRIDTEEPIGPLPELERRKP